MRTQAVAAALFLLIACQSSKDKAAGTKAPEPSPPQASAAMGSGGPATDPTAGSAGGSAGSAAGSAAPAEPPKDIDSKDILARSETAPEVAVKHVLVGWKDLKSGGQTDPRAAKRSNAEAATLAQDIAGKLKANPDTIDALMKESSEDVASVGGDPYIVKADSPYVPEFKKLALRLHEKEVGIVATQYGYHVMLRVPPPPPDPLESAEILARTTPETGTVAILQILIGWKDTVVSRSGHGDPRGMARTKADADKLAKEVLAKARGKADMKQLMKEYSEDPTSKDTQRPAEVRPEIQVPPEFERLKNMVLRLKMDEVALARSPLGWHVLKRIKPPPPPPPPPPPGPDALDSADILKREPPAASVKVKHILLGWTGAHAEDPRGVNRDRATLEKLVKETVAKLVKGAKIEPLMAELSEDTANARSGEPYPVTADAGLVPPFKNLSLRLKVGEVGVVKTQFGIHIIQRVE